MTGPDLTPEEMAALREELAEDSAPVDVDLAAGERTSSREAAYIQRQLLALKHALIDALRTRIHLDEAPQCEPVQVMGPRNAEELLASMPIIAAITQSPGDVIGYVAPDPRLSFTYIEHAFGAPSSRAPKEEGEESKSSGVLIPERPMTAVEHTTTAPFLERIVDTTVTVLGGGPLDVEILSPGMPPQLPEHADRTTVWQTDLGAGGVIIMLTPPWLDRLAVAREQPENHAQREWISSHLKRAPICLSAVLGRAHMSLNELVALQPNDIIHLDSNKNIPLQVLIEGQLKLLGVPAFHDGILGIEITEEHES